MEAPDRYNISAAHKNLIDIIYPQTSHFFTTPKPGNFGNFHDHLLRGFPELHSIRSSSGKQIKEQVSWPCWVQQVFFRARTDNPNKAEREWAIAEQEKWSPLQNQSVQVILEAYPLSSLKHNPPEYNSLPSQQTSAQAAKPQDSTQDAIIHRVESGRVVKRAVGERQSIPRIKEEEKEEDDDGENMLANIPPVPRTRTRTRPRSSPYPYPHPRAARQTPRPSSTSTHTRTPRPPRLTPPTRPRPTREQRFLRHLDSLQNHLQTSNTFLTTLGQSADQREKQLKHELRNLERHRLEIVEQRRRFVNLEYEVLRVKERFRELYEDLDVDYGGVKEEEDGSETEEDLFESDEEHGEWGSEIVGRRRSIRPEERDREPEDEDETEKDDDYDDYETDEDSHDDYDNDDDHYDDDSNNNNNLNNHNNNDSNLGEQRNTTPPTSSPPPPPIPRNIVAADFF